MLYNLGSPLDRHDFKEYCNQLYQLGKEKGVWVELSKKRHQRSIPQNSYLHLCLQYFASEFGYSLEEVKVKIYKEIVNKDIFRRERKNRRGETVPYLRSSSDLDTKEMSLSVDRFRNYSAQQGLYIPDASEYEALNEARKQIEMYAEYL